MSPPSWLAAAEKCSRRCLACATRSASPSAMASSSTFAQNQDDRNHSNEDARSSSSPSSGKPRGQFVQSLIMRQSSMTSSSPVLSPARVLSPTSNRSQQGALMFTAGSAHDPDTRLALPLDEFAQQHVTSNVNGSPISTNHNRASSGQATPTFGDEDVRHQADGVDDDVRPLINSRSVYSCVKHRLQVHKQ